MFPIATVILIVATIFLVSLYRASEFSHLAATHGTRQSKVPPPATGAVSDGHNKGGNASVGIAQTTHSASSTTVLHQDRVAAQDAVQSGVLSIIDRDSAATLDQAINEAVADRGTSDPQVAQVVSEAAAACQSEPDPWESSDLTVTDPTRTWAVERILDLCRGFERSKYSLNPPPAADAGTVKMTAGEDAAVRQALRDIATSQRLVPLVQAGTVLFETGKFPYAEVLPEGPESYGLIDLNRAWTLAVQLVLCHEQGPCGPNSLQVAVFCREKGCRPGSSLEEAYQRDLSPHDYRAVMAFAQWVARQRMP